ncbi:hypothetical protein [Bacillus sp. 1P06AnD]
MITKVIESVYELVGLKEAEHLNQWSIGLMGFGILVIMGVAVILSL